MELLFHIFLALLGIINKGLATDNCTGQIDAGNIRLFSTNDAVQLCLNYFNTSDGYLRSEWTNISTVGWTDTTTGVACRQLGLPFTDAKSFSIRQNASTVELGECTGMKDILFRDCPIAIPNLLQENVIIAINCTDVCTNGEIRLVNGTTNREGRVEVCRVGRWGTVCSFAQREQTARVVCSQLGFPSEGASLARFGEGRGSSYCFNCSGNENKLIACGNNGLFSDNHSYDIGVRCRSHDEVTVEMCPNSCIPVTTVTVTATRNVSPGIATNSTCTETTNSTIHGASYWSLTGAAVVLLIVVVIGWISTCVVLQRKRYETNNTTPVISTNHMIENNTEQDTDTHLQTNQAYELTTIPEGVAPTYDVIDCNRTPEINLESNESYIAQRNPQ